MQVELHQRPGTLLEGELHRCRMVMRNNGDSLLQNVRMIVSHPDVFCPLSNEELQQDPASRLSGRPGPTFRVRIELTSLALIFLMHALIDLHRTYGQYEATLPSSKKAYSLGRRRQKIDLATAN